MGRKIRKPARTTAAQVSLREASNSGAVYQQGAFTQTKHNWLARLVAPAIDTKAPNNYRDHVYLLPPSQTGRDGVIAGFTAWELPSGDFNVEGWLQGGDRAGMRYFSYYGPDGIKQAQEHIQRWTGRRFRVPAEG